MKLNEIDFFSNDIIFIGFLLRSEIQFLSEKHPYKKFYIVYCEDTEFFQEDFDFFDNIFLYKFRLKEDFILNPLFQELLLRKVQVFKMPSRWRGNISDLEDVFNYSTGRSRESLQYYFLNSHVFLDFNKIEKIDNFSKLTPFISDLPEQEQIPFLVLKELFR